MSKKSKIGKIYFSSKIWEGGNMSKIGKKGNVAKFFETPSNVGKKSKIGKTSL